MHSRHREPRLFSSGATSEADLPYMAKECHTWGKGSLFTKKPHWILNPKIQLIHAAMCAHFGAHVKVQLSIRISEHTNTLTPAEILKNHQFPGLRS